MKSSCRKNKSFNNRMKSGFMSERVPIEDLEFSELLCFALKIHGLDKRQVAHAIGCHYSLFKRFCNPEEPYYPNPYYIISICEVLQDPILVEWMARQLGYVLIPLEEHPMVPETTPEHDACCAMAEASTLIGNTAQALEDGKIQPEEAQTLLAILESTQRALVQLQEKLKKLVEVER